MCVLIVEPDMPYRIFLQRALSALKTDVRSEESMDGFHRAVQRQTPDTVVVGISDPDLDGIATIQKLRQDLPSDIPLIVISDKGSELITGEMLHVGVTDLISKWDASPGRVVQMVSKAL
jgi:DNA-binding response OmpR family regulator